MRVKPAALLLVGCVSAAWADTPPPAEFWLYLLEYGNAEAEVLDPLQYEEIAKPAEAQGAPADAPRAEQKEKKP